MYPKIPRLLVPPILNFRLLVQNLFSFIYLCIDHPVQVEVDFPEDLWTDLADREEEDGLNQVDDQAGDDEGHEHRNVADGPFFEVHHDLNFQSNQDVQQETPYNTVFQ